MECRLASGKRAGGPSARAWEMVLPSRGRWGMVRTSTNESVSMLGVVMVRVLPAEGGGVLAIVKAHAGTACTLCPDDGRSVRVLGHQPERRDSPAIPRLPCRYPAVQHRRRSVRPFGEGDQQSAGPMVAEGSAEVSTKECVSSAQNCLNIDHKRRSSCGRDGARR